MGEYDFVETRSKDGVCVRVYTPVGKAEKGIRPAIGMAQVKDFGGFTPHGGCRAGKLVR